MIVYDITKWIYSAVVVAALLGLSAALVAGEEVSQAGPGQDKSKTDILKADTGKINSYGLKALLDTKTPMVLLDARSGKYVDGRRIPGAVSLNAESSKEEIDRTIPSQDALVVAYCVNEDCPASRRLIKQLRKLGYAHLLHYPSGMEGWTKAGFPVEKTK